MKGIFKDAKRVLEYKQKETPLANRQVGIHFGAKTMSG